MFVHDNLYFWVQGFQKLIFVLRNFEFLPIFGKIKILNFFPKNYFYIKFSENLSTHSDYECLELKNTKFTINDSGN